MDRIVDHLFVFEGNGVVKDFRGTYSEYKNKPIGKKTGVGTDQYLSVKKQTGPGKITKEMHDSEDIPPPCEGRGLGGGFVRFLFYPLNLLMTQITILDIS